MKCVYYVLYRTKRHAPIQFMVVKGIRNRNFTARLIRNKGYKVILCVSKECFKNHIENGKIKFLKNRISIAEYVWDEMLKIDLQKEYDIIDIKDVLQNPNVVTRKDL